MKLSQLTDIENYYKAIIKKSNEKISELWINTTIDENTGFVINRCCTTGKYVADNAEGMYKHFCNDTILTGVA